MAKLSKTTECIFELASNREAVWCFTFNHDPNIGIGYYAGEFKNGKVFLIPFKENYPKVENIIIGSSFEEIIKNDYDLLKKVLYEKKK